MPSFRTRMSTTPIPTRSARSSGQSTVNVSHVNASGATPSGFRISAPGFALSKLVAEAVAKSPNAKLVLLAKHGLVTWGESAEESYCSTLEAINRAAAFNAERTTGKAAFGGVAIEPVDEPTRDALLEELLPAVRGAVSVDGPRILQVDTSAEVIEFACGLEAPTLSQVGAACPDHLVHTRRRPVFVPFEGGADLKQRTLQAIADWQRDEVDYFDRYHSDEPFGDPSPRVIVLQGIGLVSVGRTVKAARLAARSVPPRDQRDEGRFRARRVRLSR